MTNLSLLRAGRRCFLVFALLAAACSSAAPESDTDTDTETEALESTKVCPSQTVEGVDVYDGEGVIDWSKVKGAGVRFAFIKATQGTYNTQKRFASNWTSTKAAGVLRGAYHFFDPTEDGVKQAHHFLSVVGVDHGDLPMVIDLECPNSDPNCLGTGSSGKAAGSAITTRLHQWLDTVEKATGRKPIIYTFPSYFSDAGVSTAGLEKYPLWIASLNSCATTPKPWTTPTIWQYTFTGKVPGVSGDVDRDRFVGSLDQLMKLGTAKPGCAADADCNGGKTGTEKVCSTASQSCITGCHGDADCPSGKTCDKSKPTWACSGSAPAGCSSDADCNGGKSGTEKVCSTASQSCITGCHGDADCPSGKSCDKSKPTWTCSGSAPAGCSSDADCNGGKSGTEKVCSTASQSCITGCHGDADCPSGKTCDKSKPTWTCASPAPNGCKPLAFPSGVTLNTVPDAAITAQYAALGAASCSVPKCFLDVTALASPDGTKHDVHVALGPHFTLYELVHSDIDPNGTGDVDPSHAYATRVLLDPELVTHLETLRSHYGGAVSITSGYRSPAHQKALCQSICGATQCTDSSGAVTCAKNSRHMWGAAADMGLEYESAANASGFGFVFHENGGTGPHLHVDMQSCK